MSLHRAHARRNVRLAQIAALGLVALAGLLAAMPAPPPVKPAEPIASPGGPGAAGDKDSPAIDYTKAADVLGILVAKSAPLVPPTPPQEEKTGAETQVHVPEPEPVAGPPHVRFVGIASTPRRTYAFVADDQGNTQTVAQGDYIGEYMLLGISSEKMILADCDDNRHEYLIEQRPEVPPSESSINMAGTAPAFNPAGVKPAEMPGMNMPGDAQAMKERLREMEEKRAQHTVNPNNANNPKGGVQPPNRPGPGTQPRPISPVNKNAANKDAK